MKDTLYKILARNIVSIIMQYSVSNFIWLHTWQRYVVYLRIYHDLMWLKLRRRYDDAR